MILHSYHIQLFVATARGSVLLYVCAVAIVSLVSLNSQAKVVANIHRPSAGDADPTLWQSGYEHTLNPELILNH